MPDGMGRFTDDTQMILFTAEALILHAKTGEPLLIVRIPAIVGSDSADRGHPRKAYILVTVILCSGGHDGSSFGVS